MDVTDTFPLVHRIVADSDLDGMCAAVVLKKAYPDAEVHFAHAALIRSGIIDDLIDEHTVTVDLRTSGIHIKRRGCPLGSCTLSSAFSL